MSSSNSSPIDIVISRFQESLDFLNKSPFSDDARAQSYQYHVYNKGTPLSEEALAACSRSNSIKYTELNNVGKCDHTYLYHIIESYDSLAELTVFLPASCMSVGYKRVKTLQTLYTMHATGKTTFYGFFIRGLHETENFQLDHWTTSNEDNREVNTESQLTPATIRPFGRWHRALFGDDCDLNFICYNGIFAVHREDILRRPKSFYERLLQEVDNISNPEAGHYLERSWVSVFGPLSMLSLHVFIVPNDDE